MTFDLFTARSNLLPCICKGEMMIIFSFLFSKIHEKLLVETYNIWSNKQKISVTIKNLSPDVIIKRPLPWNRLATFHHTCISYEAFSKGNCSVFMFCWLKCYHDGLLYSVGNRPEFHSRWGASNEYPQHMFPCRNKKHINIFQLKKSVLCQAIFLSNFFTFIDNNFIFLQHAY